MNHRPWLALALLLVLARSAPAQKVEIRAPVISQNMSSASSFGVIWDTPRAAWMPKCDTPPTIDGQLNDPCWRQAAILTGFVGGSTNATKPYQNAARLCYDDANLYAGCEFGEPNPSRIQAAVKDHNNVQVWLDDCVELHIAVDGQKLFVPNYQGKPTWFQFITNTVGSRFAQLVCQRRPQSNVFHPQTVDGEWRSAATVGKDGFVIEIAIPWKLLQITPQDGASFRMNLGRNKPNAPEGWNTNAYHNPDRFGTVTFGRQGRDGVEIRNSLVNCAGDEWTVSVDLVAASTPQPVVLSAELKRGETVVATRKTEPVTVGTEPTTAALSLAVPEAGEYDVQVALLSGAGEAFAKGHVRAERRPLVERFFLFRRELDVGETVLKGYFRLGALPRGRQVVARYELDEGGRTLAKSDPQPVTSPEAQFDFTVPALTPGKPSFHLRLLDDKGNQIGLFTRELNVVAFLPLEREQIRFHVDEPAGVSRAQWPITAGIPFGRGMLPVNDVGSHTRVLDASGRELPCQSRVLATWTDVGRDARWVLFDFQGDIEAGKGADFAVEFGTAVKRAAVPGGPLAEESAEGTVAVNTGPLRMALSARDPGIFGDLSLDGRRITQKPSGGELYLKFSDPSSSAAIQPHQYAYRVDRSAKTFLAEQSPKDYELVVESEGPIRSVLRASGWYGSADGQRLFRYILRLYVYRNKGMVSGFHTVIATEPEQVVYSMGLRLQRAGPPREVVFGRDEGGPQTLPFAGTAEELALLQPDWRSWSVLEYPTGTDSAWGAERGSGRRAPGWLAARFPDATVLLAVKNFWQECPKELSVTRGGLLDIGFLSGRSPWHMDLRTSPFAKEEQSAGNSQGVAKTTRFVLDFLKPGTAPAEEADRAKAVLGDLAVWIDPDWMQRADPCWAPVARCTPSSEDPLRRAYANHVSMHGLNQPNAPEVVHGLPIYGILNFGDRAHSMATRGWFNNEDYDLPFHEWVAYLATGDRAVFDAVTSFTRHLMDVDTLNDTAHDPGALGLQSRHKRIHWGQPAIVTHSYVEESLLAWYLLGYERGADHAALLRQGQRIWDWWPADGWYTKENPTGAVSRDYGVNLRILMDVYRHTWDPVLLVRANELWARYSEGFASYGDHIAGYFNVPRGLELYTRYTGDPTAIEAIQKSEELCPILCADLGQPEKLQRWLGDVERSLSNAYDRLQVPWWDLQFGQITHELDLVLAIGAAERARRQGRDLKAVPGGPLVFFGARDIVFLREEKGKQPIRVRIQGTVENAHATLIGPDGKTVADRQFSTKDLPAARRGCDLVLEIPEDGPAGSYLLRLEGLTGAYMQCWLAEAPVRRVYPVGPEKFSLGAFYGTRFWFLVPKDCAAFRIGALPSNRAGRWGFAVHDGTGKVVGHRAWYFSSAIDVPETQWLDVAVPDVSRGVWWSIAYHCIKDMTFLWPKELPPVIADSPTAGFVPDEAALRRATP